MGARSSVALLLLINGAKDMFTCCNAMTARLVERNRVHRPTGGHSVLGQAAIDKTLEGDVTALWLAALLGSLRPHKAQLQLRPGQVTTLLRTHFESQIGFFGGIQSEK